MCEEVKSSQYKCSIRNRYCRPDPSQVQDRLVTDPQGWSRLTQLQWPFDHADEVGDTSSLLKLTLPLFDKGCLPMLDEEASGLELVVEACRRCVVMGDDGAVEVN